MLSPMLDAETLMMNVTNMIPDPVGFTFYQGRKIDGSKHISIIEISPNNENDFENRVAK